MTCNASKFRSPVHRAKLIRAGALSSMYPTFEGIRIPRVTSRGIWRGDKIRVRRGALVFFKGTRAPYKGSAPVTVSAVVPSYRELIAHTNSLRPCAFGPNLGDVRFDPRDLSHFLVQCGITPPGFTHPGIVEASTLSVTGWTTISEWLTHDQIRALVLAGRIRYERVEDEIFVYLVSPAVISWAGEKGYWREASMEDCERVA